MRFIPDNLKVLDRPSIHVPLAPIRPLDSQLRKLSRFPRQLFFQRVDVVDVDVAVAHRMRQRPRNEVRREGEHVGQQRVGGDVEGDAEAHVVGALVEQAVQDSLGFGFGGAAGAVGMAVRTVGRGGVVRVLLLLLLLFLLPFLPPVDPPRRIRELHVKLRKHMTRRQRHLAQIRHVPRTQNDPSVIRVVLQLPDDLSDLIHAFARVICLRVDVFGSEMPPLEPVDRTQVAFCTVREADAVQIGAGPVAVPDLDAGGGEGQGGRGAGDEPEEFSDDGAEEYALCCEEGEDWDRGDGGGGVGGAGERETELRREGDGEGACAGAIGAVLAAGEDLADQGKVLVFFVGGVESV